MGCEGGGLDLTEALLCPVHQGLLDAVGAGGAGDAVLEAGGRGFECVERGRDIAVRLCGGGAIGGLRFFAAVVEAVDLEGP